MLPHLFYQFLSATPFIGAILVAFGVFEWLRRIAVDSDALFWLISLFTGLFLFHLQRRTKPGAIEQSTHWRLLILATLAVVIPFLPAILASRLMVTGDYPAAFFNVDSPYHLSQVFSLLRDDIYPPESLNNKGIFFNYHFGAQLAATAISRHSGLSAHLAYFGIVPGFFLLSAISCIYFILAGLKTWIARCAMSFILLYHCYHFVNDWSGGRYVLDIESFNGGFPHISSLTVACLAVFIIYVYDTWRNSDIKFAAILLCPAFVLLFKSPFVFSFLAFALGYFVLEVRERRMRPRRVVLILLASVIFLFVSTHVGNGNAAFRFVGILGKLNLQWTDVLKLVLFIALPFGALALRSKSEALFKALPYLLATSIPVVFFYFFNLEINGSPDNNIRQILFLTPVWLCAAFVSLLDKVELNASQRAVLGVYFVLIGSLPVAANRIVNAGEVFRNPAGWHEYVENTGLGSCLRDVPIVGSLLVTNDLRYPANNFGRTMMQMQIPGLFGHQMFAGNAVWEKYYIDKQRFERQNVLVTGNRDSINASARELGWTHGLLFKRKHYVSGDWPVVCENDEVVIVSYQRFNSPESR